MPTSSICVGCGEVIVDHIYSVQRRRVRPTKELRPDGTAKLNPADLLDPSHAGIILGPEYDPHCQICYDGLPTVQELINAHKS